jgi:hypothetical protein
MSASRDLERRISDHYVAEAATRAPSRVLEGALSAIDTTPQRRTIRGWLRRLPPVTVTFAKLAVSVATFAVVGFVGLVLLRGPAVGPAASPLPQGSPSPSTAPSPSTSPRPSPVAGVSRFESAIHGFSIDRPSGWAIRPATEPWTGGMPAFDSPEADVIFDPALGDRVYVIVASEPLGDRTSDAWRNGVTKLCTGGGGAFGNVTVDGADAFAFSCDAVHAAALITTDTRGYLIRLVVSADEPELAETYDWGWLAAELETVDLRPEDAVDAP